jgi:protein SCO1/2
MTPEPVESPTRQQRTYALIGVLLAVLLATAAGLLWFGGTESGPQLGGPFTLENSDGKPVTDRDFRGRYMLVYFGYTFCPDVCPTTLNAVADAMERLGPRARKVQPLFITIDPRRDTPSVMKQYVAAFGHDIVGLTGSADQVAAAAKAYRVYFAEHRTGPGPDDYSMDHSSILYLMGPDGRFIAPIRADASGEEIAKTIGGLMS